MPDSLASLVMAANSSAPAPAPIPDDTEDVVEAYSFNTGTFLWLPLTMHAITLLRLHTCLASLKALDTCSSRHIVLQASWCCSWCYGARWGIR